MENQKQILVVIALITDAEGRVLLQKKRSGYPRVHGGVSRRNSRFWWASGQALVRECREEIGCEVEVGTLLPLVLSNVGFGESKQTQAIVMCYQAHIVKASHELMTKRF